MNGTFPMTQEGYDLLKQELKHLQADLLEEQRAVARLRELRSGLHEREMVLQELIKDVSREKTTLSKIANAMAHLLVRPLPALRKQTDLSDDRLSVVSAGAHGPDLPGRRSAD